MAALLGVVLLIAAVGLGAFAWAFDQALEARDAEKDRAGELGTALKTAQEKQREAAQARLKIMIECTTGNAVAQADLDLRGPGDLLGARQTGALPLRFLRYFVMANYKIKNDRSDAVVREDDLEA